MDVQGLRVPSYATGVLVCLSVHTKLKLLISNGRNLVGIGLTAFSKSHYISVKFDVGLRSFQLKLMEALRFCSPGFNLIFLLLVSNVCASDKLPASQFFGIIVRYGSISVPYSLIQTFLMSCFCIIFVFSIRKSYMKKIQQ